MIEYPRSEPGARAIDAADTVGWWIAGIAGALIGVVWNFTMSSFFTWRRGGAT